MNLSYLSTIRVADLIDIALVAFVIYQLIMFVRRTNSRNPALALIALIVALWSSERLSLVMTNYLLRKFLELGLIALVILFQPELRRFLDRFGSGIFKDKSKAGSEMDLAITQTVLACRDMSEEKTGALIIFENSDSMNDIIKTGTVVNADTNAELLKNIFFHNAPLHDGAVVIKKGRIAAAGCVLPLTHSTNLSKDLGMRHRAGIGLSEQSDAVVVIVSEETGSISIAREGMLKRHQSPAMCEKILRQQLISDDTQVTEKGLSSIIKRLISVDADEER